MQEPAVVRVAPHYSRAAERVYDFDRRLFDVEVVQVFAGPCQQLHTLLQRKAPVPAAAKVSLAYQVKSELTPNLNLGEDDLSGVATLRNMMGNIDHHDAGLACHKWRNVSETDQNDGDFC